jgi:hypothetical protein
MQHSILYLAYGPAAYINECRYSLLKYLEVYKLKPPASVNLIVYTDQPASFEAFTPFFHHFEMKEISQTLVKEWQGDKDLAHRVKLKAMQEFFEHREGSLLCCDSNTYITAPLEPIFSDLENNTFYLLPSQSRLSDPRFSRMRKYLEALPEFEHQGAMQLWKDGVIGLNHQSKQVLEEALQMTDGFATEFPKQFIGPVSLTFLLQKHGAVKSASPQIEHYSDVKEFRSLLDLFFQKNTEESIPNLVKLVSHLNAGVILKSKKAYENLPFLRKWLLALSGKKWSIKQFEKKI